MTLAQNYLSAVLSQNEDAIKSCFLDDARIDWPCTNESFTPDAFAKINCVYPGKWTGEVLREAYYGDAAVSVARVRSAEPDDDGKALSFHVTSFYKISDGKIASLEEYWAEDGPAPQWRLDMGIGRPCEKASDEIL